MALADRNPFEFYLKTENFEKRGFEDMKIKKFFNIRNQGLTKHLNLKNTLVWWSGPYVGF